MSTLPNQQQDLPRPTQFDELSTIFYPQRQQQETTRVGGSIQDHSINSNLFVGVSNNTGLLEEIVKEGMKRSNKR
ncbi:unnamed protein product [Arabis nemorensis]|uniref:Uncharacterized protein n=1 Tax=Arabis nemorensis TaxID=586526 RepID=A0A565BX13_9BRAS|nr:unnamed protein product [Arabis nemorensis]